MLFPTSLEPLRLRDFRLQFVASAASVIGSNVAPIAVAFAILSLHGSGADLGIALAARTVSTLLLTPAAGVWGDRLPRHRIMVGSNVGEFVCQALLAGLLLAHSASISTIIVIQAVRGVADAFFLPATTGLTAELVPSAYRQQANALMSLARSTSTIIGPAIAGVLIAATRPAWGLALDAATFALSAILLMQIRLPAKARMPVRGGFLADLAVGWREVRTRQWIWVSIVTFMLFQLVVLSTFFVLGPVVSEQDLHGATSWAIIMGAVGIGALAGDVLALHWRPLRPMFVATISAAFSAPVLLLLAAHVNTVLIAGAAALLGLTFTFPDTLWLSTLQNEVPDDVLARVSAYDWTGSMVLRPIGYAAAGALAGLVGAGPILVGSAIAVVTVQAAAALVPSIRGLHRREDTAALASAEPERAPSSGA